MERHPNEEISPVQPHSHAPPPAFTDIISGPVVIRNSDGPAPRRDWRSVGESDHVVQFYESDAFLAETVGDFVADGLRAGEGAIVVATSPHRAGIRERLRASGFDMCAAETGSQYVALDAAELLAAFLVDGSPDAQRFADIVGGLIARVAEPHRKVRVFGEMVALLLMDGNHSATLRLEQLWNELGDTQSFSLLCAYPIHYLGSEVYAATLAHVCAEHSTVIPAEDYTSLAEPNERLSAIAALQQKASWLEAEIAERKQAEEQLRSALEAERNARRIAENALLARDEFLAGAAHELKTPLTVLIGQAQLAVRRLGRDNGCDPESIARSLREIARQGDALAHRVNQILKISQLDDPTFALEREPCDLVPLLRRVASGSWIGPHPIQVDTPASLRVVVDPRRFEQVLTNLLDNAVRYSPDGGPIDVRLAYAEAGIAELSVRDHGLGIPLEKRDHIFDRFSAAHGDEYRSGMGLGLNVSRRIVELHGGEIQVAFPLDGGSCFTVRLPTGLEVANGQIPLDRSA